MKRDIRACSKSELDAINLEIARYKAERSGVKQSDISTLDEVEKDSIPLEGNTSNAEQLDLF